MSRLMLADGFDCVAAAWWCVSVTAGERTVIE